MSLTKPRRTKRTSKSAQLTLEETVELEKRSTRTHSLWFNGLKSDEEKSAFYKRLKGSVDIFEKLDEIIVWLYRPTLSKNSDFTLPSWPYLKAYQEGYKRALHDLYTIIPDKDQFNDQH